MIYLDNASTSHPKPSVVAESITHYLKEIGVSPGRGSYSAARRSDALFSETKKRSADLIGVKDSRKIHFTSNATHALNILFHGLFKQNDRVVTTCLEHNSVLRPLFKLSRERNLSIEILACNELGEFDFDEVDKILTPETKFLVLNHASNVIGTIAPLEKLASICRKRSVKIILDASQTAGCLDIDSENLGLDYVVTTGHKSIRGPSGTGFFYASDISDMECFMVGGNGDMSNVLDQSLKRETFFEAGTANYLGIAGLNAAMRLSEETVPFKSKAMALIRNFIDMTDDISKLVIYGPTKCLKNKVPVLSFNIKGVLPNEFCAYADKNYQIMLRGGLHCAPFVHKVIGTYPTGTVRLSVGHNNTNSDITNLSECIRGYIRERLK